MAALRALAVAVTLAASTGTAFATEIDRQKLTKQLTRHEGKRLTVYKDSEGIPTIGIGFNLQRADAKEKIEALGLDFDKVLSGGTSLTDEQAEALLDGDITTSIADCRLVVANYDDLSDVRKRVVIDMTFNLGKTRFSGFKKMIAAVEAGDFDKATVEMTDSRWCRQVKTRCTTLRKMMKTG